MFDELNKYSNNGHFNFKLGDSLQIVSNKVPNLPGVYYIIGTVKDIFELVYIGKSGTMQQNGKFKKQLLRTRINNNHGKISRENYFLEKMESEKIVQLRIYWFVTYDENHKDLPASVEAELLQKYFNQHQVLPLWNKEF